jgi:uncharacterized membrane protein
MPKVKPNTVLTNIINYFFAVGRKKQFSKFYNKKKNCPKKTIAENWHNLVTAERTLSISKLASSELQIV